MILNWGQLICLKDIYYRNLLFKTEARVFDCCKQSLNRLQHPPIHPSIHPPIHPVPEFFAQKVSDSQFILIETHSKFLTQNFQLIIFDANAQHFLFQTLFHCKIYNFLK